MSQRDKIVSYLQSNGVVPETLEQIKGLMHSNPDDPFPQEAVVLCQRDLSHSSFVKLQELLLDLEWDEESAEENHDETLAAVFEDASEVMTPRQIFLTGLLVGKSHGKISIRDACLIFAEINQVSQSTLKAKLENNLMAYHDLEYIRSKLKLIKPEFSEDAQEGIKVLEKELSQLEPSINEEMSGAEDCLFFEKLKLSELARKQAVEGFYHSQTTITQLEAQVAELQAQLRVSPKMEAEQHQPMVVQLPDQLPMIRNPYQAYQMGPQMMNQVKDQSQGNPSFTVIQPNPMNQSSHPPHDPNQISFGVQPPLHQEKEPMMPIYEQVASQIPASNDSSDTLINDAKLAQRLQEEEQKFHYDQWAASNQKKPQALDMLCPVCNKLIYDQVSERSEISLGQCKHLVHKNCIIYYCYEQKASKGALIIECPVANCHETISKAETVNFLNQIRKRNYEQPPSFVMCQTKSCPFVHAHPEINPSAPIMPILECPLCGGRHQEPLPNQRNQVPEAHQKLQKQCPKCTYWVQKRSTSNMITCRCGCQFCFDCGLGQCICFRIPQYSRNPYDQSHLFNSSGMGSQNFGSLGSEPKDKKKKKWGFF